MSNSTSLLDYLGEGTLASRPASPPISASALSFYYATDTLELFLWNGSAWVAARNYDIPWFVSGKPGNSQTILRLNAVRAFTLPASLTGFKASVGTNPTSAWVFTFNKNGSSIGSVSFSTSGTPTVTFASSVSFAIGDILTVVAQSTADATGADASMTFLAAL